MRKHFKLRVHHYILFALILISATFLVIQPLFPTNLPFVKKKNAPIPVDQFDFAVLNETGKPEESVSQNWWLNSGGIVNFSNNTLSTNQGSINSNSKWFKAYLTSNPQDTDGGLHPQNLFRLVSKNNLQNIEQSVLFKINRTIMSKSPNRNASNGILFFNRYNDGDNLYYTGVRVDGTGIIKKKKSGIYNTVAQNPVFEGSYNINKQPNLLPENKWIGLKSEVKNLSFKDVSLKVYIDKNNNGNWELIAEAIDTGDKYNGASFINAGRFGIRTDFMDVEFMNFKVKTIN
jgi:hypothetical protein